MLLSRLPFLDAGYGSDPDSWRVAETAWQLAHGGAYQASRLPGNPVHEYLTSVLINGGWIATNLATAVASAIAVFLFCLILNNRDTKRTLLLGIAFAIVPVVYISSVSTIDYIWALLFLLGSLYALMRSQGIIAGVLLGLAIGCRITSAVFLIPSVLLMLQNRQSVAQVLRFAAVTIIVSVAVYLPLLETYGLGFLGYYHVSMPSLGVIWNRGIVKVWGGLGFAVLLAAFLFYTVQALRKRVGRRPSDWSKLHRYSVVAIALMLLLFVWSPYEPGYLLPIVPFVLILAERSFSTRAIMMLTVALFLSVFVSGNRQDLIASGPVLRDRESRMKDITFAREVRQTLDTIPKPRLLIAGWFKPMIDGIDRAGRDNADTTAYSIDLLSCQRYQESGGTIYLLPKMEAFNQDIYHFSLEKEGAILLPLSP